MSSRPGNAARPASFMFMTLKHFRQPAIAPEMLQSHVCELNKLPGNR